MLYERNGRTPRLPASAVVADSARLVGDVTVGERCYIDHGVVIESSGAPITLGDETIVLANSVLRSVGGASRPAFPVTIGRRTLVGPACVLTGCQVGAHCYLATAVLIFHGAEIGDGTRVGAGAIVHHHTRLPRGGRVGLREIAVQGEAGPVCTGDVAMARELLARSDFFGTVFEEQPVDQAELHDRVLTRLLDEVMGWDDRPLG